MLLGVREHLSARLIAAGERVRIYVPYGEAWYAYSVRQAAREPEHRRPRRPRRAALVRAGGCGERAPDARAALRRAPPPPGRGRRPSRRCATRRGASRPAAADWRADRRPTATGRSGGWPSIWRTARCSASRSPARQGTACARGVLAAEAENALLWPFTAVLDRLHPDVRSGAWPPMAAQPARVRSGGARARGVRGGAGWLCGVDDGGSLGRLAALVVDRIGPALPEHLRLECGRAGVIAISERSHRVGDHRCALACRRMEPGRRPRARRRRPQ